MTSAADRLHVLIVGAGPTGLMLANQLARRGVKPMIIDRHSGPAQQSRAMAVQARTLEIYAKLGIAERALALGARSTAANMWVNGRRTARIPIGDIGTSLSPFPFILMLGQDDNEHIMGEKLAKLGVAVQWNTELTGLTQHGDHVEATIKLPDGGHRTMRAEWLAGCDGSRSPVRELSGIEFPGAPYEHVFFVADTEAIGSMRQVFRDRNRGAFSSACAIHAPPPSGSRCPRGRSPESRVPTFLPIERGGRGCPVTCC
jgi:2-polyprenyl-6-methoxyphenol hydroxylase-like FAD-dependent oxidoreductase